MRSGVSHLPRLAVALLLGALALVVSGPAALHPAVANPEQIWIINENVAAALNSGVAVPCTPAGVDAVASQLDAFAAGSAGQINADTDHAGKTCIVVRTDGSTTPVTINGRGLSCVPGCDGVTAAAPSAQSNGVFATSEQADSTIGTAATGSVITVVEDAVAVDTSPMTIVTQAHDVTLIVTKPTVQEAAASCAITDSISAPTRGGAALTYTDVNDNPLVGYTATWASSSTSSMTVALPATVSMQSGTAVAASNVYCGIAAGAATLFATAPGDEIFGVATGVTRTANITVTGVPASIALTASPAVIPCDGVSAATVAAKVTDSAGNDVVDGTPVAFNVVALGTSNPINTTTTAGSASSTITPLYGVTAGVVVQVTAGDAASSIRIDCLPLPGPGDSSRAPLVVDRIPFTRFVDTTGFTIESGESLPCGNMGATVWLELDLPLGNTALTVDTVGSGFSTALAIYASSPVSPPPISPPPAGATGLLGCNAGGAASAESFFPSAGSYLIQVGGQNGATGNLQINITCTGDADCDGLTDADEASLGTDPNSSDSDGDGLSDGLEAHTLHTNPLAADTDADECGDALELNFVPPLDPLDAWDFYSVPVPALLLGQASTRDAGIGVTTDVVALLKYAGMTTASPAYAQDMDANGVPDGEQYDRSLLSKNGKPYAGAPDGGIGVTTDVVAMLAWAGKLC